MRTIRRCIPLHPHCCLHYLVDANFLSNRYINSQNITNSSEIDHINKAKDYWKLIIQQINEGCAKVFVSDVCIAETFKTLAKKYYSNESPFPSYNSYKNACDKLRKEISLPPKLARSSNRKIIFHDIQTTRDIIISIDRFFEKACSKYRKVSTFDLMIIATGKYLMDFYGFNKDNLFIITQDRRLYYLAKSYMDLPKVFNPDINSDNAYKVFIEQPTRP
jgi:hypothetical protein